MWLRTLQANQEIMALQDAAFRQSTAAWQATMAAGVATRSETDAIAAQIAAQRGQLEALQATLISPQDFSSRDLHGHL